MPFLPLGARDCKGKGSGKGLKAVRAKGKRGKASGKMRRQERRQGLGICPWEPRIHNQGAVTSLYLKGVREMSSHSRRRHTHTHTPFRKPRTINNQPLNLCLCLMAIGFVSFVTFIHGCMLVMFVLCLCLHGFNSITHSILCFQWHPAFKGVVL